jgi:two-component system sensor histidine kinase BaeS
MTAHDNSQLAEVIHEMRNQLAVAKANLEAFIDGKLPPTAQRLKNVMQTLDQMEQLIKDLRGLQPVAAPADPAKGADLIEINVCKLLEREFASMEAVALEKQVSLSVFRCPHPNAACQHFYGDPGRIGQIVKNVLLNAVRYTPRGGTITVDCRRRADELQVTIGDTGPGVPTADAGRIFEAGFRGAASRQEGSGLGLAVVKELVEAHGGSIRLDPESKLGASFILRLPGRLPDRGSPASP